MLLNRLWLLAVSALLAAGLSWLYPQVAAVVAGGAILVALAWRKQERRGDGDRGTRRRALLRGADLARSARIELDAHPGLPPHLRQRRRAVSRLSQPPRLRSFPAARHVRVFATCSLVSQARRAVAMP